jgi:hypothetical protein
VRWVSRWTTKDLGGWNSPWVGVDGGGGLETGEVSGALVASGGHEV